MEILSILIRNNKDIKGIIINEKEHKLSQYADATLFFLDGTDKSLNETLNVLSDFASFSGLKINFGKTHAVWIGLKKVLPQSRHDGNFAGEKQTLNYLELFSKLI